MNKSYIVWYRDNNADDPTGMPHQIMSGKNAGAVKRLWKLMYPERKIVRMRVWH